MSHRIVITGASGMLGSRISRQLGQKSELELFEISRKAAVAGSGAILLQGDLTDKEFLNRALAEARPDTVIHCAANTNVNLCEEAPEEARKIHVEASANLAVYHPDKTRFIYISTDSVYDGQKGSFTEDDPTAPINVYAKTKLEGERAVLETNPRALILRTNIYGFHQPPGVSLAEWGLGALSRGEEMKGFRDVFFNPLYTGQLAAFTEFCLEHSEISGILNVGSAESISKLEFLTRLAETFEYDSGVIRSISVDDLEFSANRPKNTSLNLNKLKSIYGSLPDLTTGLRDFKNDYTASK